MNLYDKVIVITGSANGIGKECAYKLDNEGANIVIVDIDEKKNGEKVARKLTNNGIFVKTDISKRIKCSKFKKYNFKKIWKSRYFNK